MELLTGDGGVWVGVTVTVEGGAQALAVSPAIHGYSFSIAPVIMEEKYKVSFAEYQQRHWSARDYIYRISSETLKHKKLTSEKQQQRHT